MRELQGFVSPAGMLLEAGLYSRNVLLKRRKLMERTDLENCKRIHLSKWLCRDLIARDKVRCESLGFVWIK